MVAWNNHYAESTEGVFAITPYGVSDRNIRPYSLAFPVNIRVCIGRAARPQFTPAHDNQIASSIGIVRYEDNRVSVGILAEVP
jgi:hypothetical protein